MSRPRSRTTAPITTASALSHAAFEATQRPVGTRPGVPTAAPPARSPPDSQRRNATADPMMSANQPATMRITPSPRIACRPRVRNDSSSVSMTVLAGASTVPDKALTTSRSLTFNAKATSGAFTTNQTPMAAAISGRRRASRKAMRYSSATTGSSHVAIGRVKA